MDKESTIGYLRAMNREMKAAERHMEAEALRTALDELENADMWTNSLNYAYGEPWAGNDEWHNRALLLWYAMRNTVAWGCSKPEDVAEAFRRLYGPQGDKNDRFLRQVLEEAKAHIKAIETILPPVPSEEQTEQQ